MSRLDQHIKKVLIDRLCQDGQVDLANVKVAVKDGQVTLSGAVFGYLASHKAEVYASHILGVSRVINNIVVQYPSTEVLPDDANLKSNLINVLKLYADIDIYHIEVLINNRWVTLEGHVQQLWEKYLIEELACTVYGIKGITNNILIFP
ncbi:MAG: BON domain-containing protein [bacterium]